MTCTTTCDRLGLQQNKNGKDIQGFGPERNKMRATETAVRVLREIAQSKNRCGGRDVADIMGLCCGRTTSVNGGQYAGKLRKAGWITRQRNCRKTGAGKNVLVNVTYQLTNEGLALLANHKQNTMW